MGNMAKKATGKLKAGAKICVKPGMTAPELPDVSIAGWTGVISETAGKKSDPKYMVEWDEATLAQMPATYVQLCEDKQLYYRMACLSRDDFDLVGE